MYVVTVEFRLSPTRVAEFLSLVVANASDSREQEPGCQQFDVCNDPDQPSHVFLYEVYEDRDAFDAHLRTAHFRSFDAAARGMVTEKIVHTWQRRAP
ncbi:MAG: antibiotic biosynthesis monooxygenase [Burkholderiales bacterium]|jgi:quinol monooxygenase YgiN|nr:antibiotic biosynthesis monooxygenase [Burkholderiales bacterium]